MVFWLLDLLVLYMIEGGNVWVKGVAFHITWMALSVLGRN